MRVWFSYCLAIYLQVVYHAWVLVYEGGSWRLACACACADVPVAGMPLAPGMHARRRARACMRDVIT
eukprot:COSAG02_NODE_2979_length_7625_cov_73.716715_4_plen_67_part_00